MHERVEMNPNIMGGKPVIRGTRVPVEAILRKLGAGMPESEILADHPHLTVEDIRIRFAPSGLRFLARWLVARRGSAGVSIKSVENASLCHSCTKQR